MRQIKQLTFGGFCVLLMAACISAPVPQTSILPSPEPTATRIRQSIVSPIPAPGFTLTPEPSLAYDLLFLGPIDMNNYQLMLWDRMTSQTKVLITNEESDLFFSQRTGPTPSRIVHYSLTADHRELAVARVRIKPQGAYGAEEYELVLFDIDTQESKSLAKSESEVYWTSISPDGHWLAYRYGFMIYALQTDSPEQGVNIGTCGGDCVGPSWSPDNRMLAWSDEQGVWLASLNEPRATLIAAGKRLVVTDGKRGIYAPPAWSPDGRYLLVRSNESEVGEWSIIDTRTGRSGRLPNSREYPRPNVHSIWLDDGRLFVVRSSDVTTGLSPTGELWKVDSANKDLLIFDQAFVIPASPEVYPTEPTQFDDGRLAFVLLSPDDAHASETGLYAVDLKDYRPRRISEQLPSFDQVEMVYASWLPDGTGALVQSGTNSLARVFVWTDDFLPASVPQYMGPGFVCCFTWIR